MCGAQWPRSRTLFIDYVYGRSGGKTQGAKGPSGRLEPTGGFLYCCYHNATTTWTGPFSRGPRRSVNKGSLSFTPFVFHHRSSINDAAVPSNTITTDDDDFLYADIQAVASFSTHHANLLARVMAPLHILQALQAGRELRIQFFTD